ncbi:hypothetical protein Ancab_039181, partial [Ancistrocladus abbreviatus]
NGMMKSTVHRVVTNSERDKISLAMFCTLDPENEIGPANELVSDDRPHSYKKVKNYRSTYYHYYQLGETPLTALKMQVMNRLHIHLLKADFADCAR